MLFSPFVPFQEAVRRFYQGPAAGPVSVGPAVALPLVVLDFPAVGPVVAVVADPVAVYLFCSVL